MSLFLLKHENDYFKVLCENINITKIDTEALVLDASKYVELEVNAENSKYL